VRACLRECESLAFRIKSARSPDACEPSRIRLRELNGLARKDINVRANIIL